VLFRILEMVMKASPKLATVKSINFGIIMRKSRFTESQIVGIFAQYGKGLEATVICRENSISQPANHQGRKSIQSNLFFS